VKASFAAATPAGARALPRPPSFGGLSSPFVVSAATAVTAVVVGYGVSTGSTKIVAAPIALLGLFVLSATTWMPYVAVLLVAGTFAEPYAYPQFSFAGINPFLSELVLGMALVAAAFVAASRRRVPSESGSPLVGIALLVFLIAVLLGIAVGMSNGVTLFGALTQMRERAFIATFWLALLAFRTPASRLKTFWLLSIVAVAVVVLQIAQFLIGTAHILFYTKDPTINLITCSSGQCADFGQSGFSGLIRVRPPGLTLVYVVAAFSACYALFGPSRKRTRALSLFAVCLTGLTVSLTRDYLLGLGFGLMVAFAISPRKSRLFGAVIGAAAVTLALVIAAQRGALHSAGPVLSRFTTITNPSEVRSEASLKQRSIEDHLAFRAIRHNPIQGIGWGASYGKTDAVVVRGQTIGQADQPFIHNLYLGLWMRTGILGLAAYVIAILAGVVYGIRWCRRRRWDDESWLGAGVVASILAVSFSAVVNIGTGPENVIPLMGALALAVTLSRDQPGSRTRSSVDE
jgi:hypothetical protein